MTATSDPHLTTRTPHPLFAKAELAAAAALFTVLAVCLVAFFAYGWSVLVFPYPVDYAEGPLLDQTARLSRFENVYRALTTPPFTVANYPPLYMLLQTPLTRLLGPALWYGRLLSWLSTLFAALLSAAILWRLTRDRTACVATAMLLLSVPYVSYWSPLYRIDSLALALSLAGLYVVIRWGRTNWAAICAALLFVAAVYTRQSYGLVGPLTAAIWLTRYPAGRRRALSMLAVFAGSGLGLLLAASLLTGGAFYFHVVRANVNHYDPRLLAGYALELARLMPVLLGLAAVGLIATPSPKPAAWRFVVPYLAAASLVGLTIGKVGSNVNYLLELSVALCLTAGMTLAALRRRPLARAVVLLLLAAQAFAFIRPTRYHERIRWKLEQRDAFDAVSRLLRATEGPILADEDMGLLVLTGRRVWLQPFEVSQLAASGVWDQSPVLESLDSGAYAAVLVYTPPGSEVHRRRWTPEMLEAIDRGYRAAGSIGFTTVFYPHPTRLEITDGATVRRTR